MREYLIMLLVSMAVIALSGYVIGALVLAWIIIGRAQFIKRNSNVDRSSPKLYLIYLLWPFSAKS